MAAKSTNTKKSSTNNTAKAAKNATTKKTSTAKKASASTKKSSGSKTKRTSNHINNTSQSQEIRSEILLLGALAICILLILSNFGMGGIAGGAISSVGFGLVGAMAYLFPFVFFGAVAFYISNKGNPHAYIKVGAAIVLVILLCGILELMFHPYTAGTSVLSYYKDSSADKNAGGLLGGILISILCPLIGEAGTYVILIIFSIICIILVTERSLLAPLGRHGKKAYQEVKRKHQETAEIRTLERDARKEALALKQREKVETSQADASSPSEKKKRTKRTDLKASGITFATTLLSEEESPVGGFGRTPKSPEITELVPEKEPNSKDLTDSFEDHFVINRAEPAMDVQEEIPFDDALHLEPVQTPASRQENEMSSEHDPAADPMIENSPEIKQEHSRKSSKKDAQAVAAETASVEQTIREQEQKPRPVYHTPPLNLLKKGKKGGGDSDEHLRATALKLEQTLQNFGVGVHVTNASCGPSVTRYELQPEQGVKVSRIVGLADDIKLNLAVADLRIEAPIPGKAAVGIEVPNSENTAVMLGDLLESKEFKNSKSPISFAVGKDIAGKVVVTDIAKMPHLLVAGATGSGKSVCINTLIMSVIYKADPDDVKLILVDPKVVELSVYNGIPHLMIPVVTDMKKAAGALNWAVAEMEKRYKLFAQYNVRDLKGFNEKVKHGETGPEIQKKLPQIVIIIDELADLMMVAPGEVEGAICRLAQLARAAGLHLILATQRPSVNVITGLIKANMPSRIAFSVSSGVDSRTIIDMNGAEKLLGKGDMLFYPSGYPKPVRVQGSFVSDEEVQKVVDYLIDKNGNTSYSNELEEQISSSADLPGQGMFPGQQDSENSRDVYFADAGNLIIDKEKASIGMLQRMFKIGFNRAARIMDQLCEAGVVGPEEGTKPRKVLMTKEEFAEYMQNQTS